MPRGADHQDIDDPLGGTWFVKTIYYEDDDILEIHVSDQPVVREVSHGWNLNIAYAADGSVVEIVLLEAREQGVLPVTTERAAA